MSPHTGTEFLSTSTILDADEAPEPNHGWAFDRMVAAQDVNDLFPGRDTLNIALADPSVNGRDRQIDAALVGSVCAEALTNRVEATRRIATAGLLSSELATGRISRSKMSALRTRVEEIQSGRRDSDRDYLLKLMLDATRPQRAQPAVVEQILTQRVVKESWTALLGTMSRDAGAAVAITAAVMEAAAPASRRGDLLGDRHIQLTRLSYAHLRVLADAVPGAAEALKDATFAAALGMNVVANRAELVKQLPALAGALLGDRLNQSQGVALGQNVVEALAAEAAVGLASHNDNLASSAGRLLSELQSGVGFQRREQLRQQGLASVQKVARDLRGTVDLAEVVLGAMWPQSRRTVRSVTTVARAGIDLYSSAALYGLGALGPVGLAAAAIGSIGAVVKLFRSSGPSQEDLMLQGMQTISEQVREVAEVVQRVEARTARLLQELYEVSRAIAVSRRIMERRFDRLEAAFRALGDAEARRARSDRLEAFDLAAAEARALFAQPSDPTVTTAITLRRSRFFSHALTVAANSDFAGPARAEALSEVVDAIHRAHQADSVFAACGAIAAVIGLQIDDPPNVNPTEWARGVFAYLECLKARGDHLDKAALDDLLALWEEGGRIADATRVLGSVGAVRLAIAKLRATALAAFAPKADDVVVERELRGRLRLSAEEIRALPAMQEYFTVAAVVRFTAVLASARTDRLSRSDVFLTEVDPGSGILLRSRLRFPPMDLGGLRLITTSDAFLGDISGWRDLSQWRDAVRSDLAHVEELIRAVAASDLEPSQGIPLYDAALQALAGTLRANGNAPPSRAEVHDPIVADGEAPARNVVSGILVRSTHGFDQTRERPMDSAETRWFVKDDFVFEDLLADGTVLTEVILADVTLDRTEHRKLMYNLRVGSGLAYHGIVGYQGTRAEMLIESRTDAAREDIVSRYIGYVRESVGGRATVPLGEKRREERAIARPFPMVNLLTAAGAGVQWKEMHLVSSVFPGREGHFFWEGTEEQQDGRAVLVEWSDASRCVTLVFVPPAEWRSRDARLRARERSDE